MRLRFFLITSFAVLASAVSVAFIHFSFVRIERLRLIDSQIRSSAAVLVNSELGDLKKINFKRAEEIISEELGPNRIGKLFIIRNQKDEIVFQSDTANALKMEFPRSPQWVTIQSETFFVRILNLDLPNVPDRTLQVGLVLDPNFLGWGMIHQRVIGLSILIVCLALTVSIGMTIALLGPSRKLIAYLKRVSKELQNLRDLPDLPSNLTKYQKGWVSGSDEFAQLLGVVQRLVERINSSHQLLRIWSTRMAHELKTPLTVLKTGIETRQFDNSNSRITDRDLIREIDFMANTISEFLSWTELEHSGVKGDLHAFDVSQSLESICRRFDTIAPNRIALKIETKFSILASITHFDQLISNLLNNALKYSPRNSVVEVVLSNSNIVISNSGAGIPAHVLSHLGQPFNRGSKRDFNDTSSTGLGLAIALSIAKHYGWEVSFRREKKTIVSVGFDSSRYRDTEFAGVEGLAKSDKALNQSTI